MRTITCVQKSYAEAIVCWSVWLRVTFVRNAQQKFMILTESFFVESIVKSSWKVSSWHLDVSLDLEASH